MTNLPRPRSGPLTTGPARAPQRAMLRAVGLSEDDLQLPQIAVASSWNEVTPCNLHLNGLAKAAKEGVRQAGAVPIEFGTIARAACPGAGSCAGMYTANTMSACSEALGMALPGAASPPAVSAERTALARATGEAAVQALAAGLRPRDIMTRTAFLNAAAVVMATAGSTNAILHLLAIAAEAQVELTLDDFDVMSRRTPLIASMRPAGRYVMSELDQAGGLPVVLRELLEAGLIDGSTVAVHGRPLPETAPPPLPP